MKFGILSDLHQEFDKTPIPWDFVPEEGVFYLNAGDTNSRFLMRNYWLEQHKDHMFWITGNHDFYGGEFEKPDQMKETNVNGLKIIGATLWTDLTNPLDWTFYKNGLVDNRHIKNLTYDNYNNRHKEHTDFIFNNDADIIVTHHCPTLKSISPVYGSSPLNRSFSNDYEQAILNMKKPPKLWVCGHTHWKHSYKIGETLVLCNPRGYPRENEYYETYQPEIIEIETP